MSGDERLGKAIAAALRGLIIVGVLIAMAVGGLVWALT